MQLPWQKKPLALNSPRDLPGLALWLDSKDVSSLRNDAGAQPVTTDGIKLASDKSGNSSTNVLCLNGVAGNYGSAPDSVPLSITGDIGIEGFIAPSSWTPAANMVINAKDVGGVQRSWILRLNTAGTISLFISQDGSTPGAGTSTVSTGLSAFAAKWVRATWRASDGRVQFFLSDDGVTWVQLGADATLAVASIFNSTAVVEVGSRSTGSLEVFSGIIYRSRVYNGIPVSEGGSGATLVFDANFATFSKLAATGTESSSNAATVTINSTGATGARISGARDLYQGVVANQPVLNVWSGTNYGYLNGVAGNYYSTPDSAAVSITGDIDLRVAVNITTLVGGELISKWGAAGQRSYELLVNSASGDIRLNTSVDGTASVSFISSANISTGFQWIRGTLDVDNGAAGKTATFYTSPDGVTWTLLGVAQTSAGTTSIFDGTAQVEVGSRIAGTNPFSGLIYRAQIYNGIAGSVVFDFDPAAYSSGTTFLDAAGGATITLNGGSTIVTRTCLYFDGSNDYLKAAAFALAQPETVYFVGSQVTWTDSDAIYDGFSASTRMLLNQRPSGASPQLAIFGGTAYSNTNSGLAVATVGIVTAVFNNASSLLRVNRNAAVTGTIGTNAANGFTLASAFDGTFPANITAQEVLVYSGAHDKATQDRVIAYLANRNRIALT